MPKTRPAARLRLHRIVERRPRCRAAPEVLETGVAAYDLAPDGSSAPTARPGPGGTADGRRTCLCDATGVEQLVAF